MFKSFFKYLLKAILFVLYTGVGGVIDHYSKISQFFINITEKISGNFYIMTDLWASWIIIIFFGLIITFICDKAGLNNWLFNKIWNTKSTFLKQDDIELIINNLLQNVSNYEAFYNYYTKDYRPNKQYEANILPYVEDILLILESNEYLLSLLDITMLLDSNISIKLMDFYKKSQQHFSKLKDYKNCINTYDLSVDEHLVFFKKFGVTHLQTNVDIKNGINTVDIYQDFNNFMDNDYVPKIQELTIKAKELINALTSKHIA